MQGNERPCPTCLRSVGLLRMSSGWLGRYERCPSCQTPLVLVFNSVWIETVYCSLYPATAIYAWLAAETVAYHFARPGDTASQTFWSIVGTIAAIMPGLRLSMIIANRFGELAKGSMSDLNPWKGRRR